MTSEFIFWRDSTFGWRVANLMTTKFTQTLNGMPIRLQASDYSYVLVDDESPLHGFVQNINES